MNCKVMGVKRLDFDEIHGRQIWVAFDEKDVEGKACERYFISDTQEVPELSPNQNIDVIYNRKGKIESIKILSGKQLTINS